MALVLPEIGPAGVPLMEPVGLLVSTFTSLPFV
jgi:hypothetical protein